MSLPPPIRARLLAAVLLSAALLALCGCNRKDRPTAPPPTSASPKSAPSTERVVGPLSDADAQSLATMNDALKQYLGLHRRIENALPKLPKDATPQQIDAHQRTFESRLRRARATSHQGEIFTARARPVILRLVAAAFSGPDGKLLRASIMDEAQASPSAAKVAVNARYPDSVPLASVPPQVLQTLPQLSEDLEYRFLGDALILLDSRAHLVADYIENALPKV